jgi:hypothetical protein
LRSGCRWLQSRPKYGESSLSSWNDAALHANREVHVTRLSAQRRMSWQTQCLKTTEPQKTVML